MSHRIFFTPIIGIALLSASTGWSQTLPAAARQALILPPAVVTVAIWPPEFVGQDLSPALVSTVSDQLEQALSRKASELRLKVVSRRQIDAVVRELKLSSLDPTSFDTVAKSRSIDAILVSTVSLVRPDCLSISIKTLGTAEPIRSQILNASKVIRVGISDEEPDFDGCETVERLNERASVSRRREPKVSEVAVALPIGPVAKTSPSAPPLVPEAMGKRIALVIGNAKYNVKPLSNPVNDADDVSKALKGSGFDVVDVRDASLREMNEAARTFGDRLKSYDVGLVYYSGHGIEWKGRNYLIPVNADIKNPDEIPYQTLDMGLVLDKMATANKSVNIMIIDACRDGPTGRSFRSSSSGLGLAAVDAPKGSLIAFATSPGKVASDGQGRNSPYTKALVQAIQQPNRKIEEVFKEVRRAVQSETKDEQTPWENTSLSGDFYFRVQK